jgi:hypothetical protein
MAIDAWEFEKKNGQEFNNVPPSFGSHYLKASFLVSAMEPGGGEEQGS